MNLEYMCNPDVGLGKYCKHWDDIIVETVDGLGEQDAFHIHDVHIQNWISIIEWMQEEDTLEEKAVVERFTQLFNELRWMHFLFLVANYQAVYWKLRYGLELAVQAYDLNQQSQGRNLTLDEQMQGAAEIEEDRYTSNIKNWITSALCEILNENEEEIEEWFGPLWILMNKNIHPSPKEMHVTVNRDPAALYWDSFDSDRAREVLMTSNAVGDIVLRIVFSTYPELVNHAAKSDPFCETLDVLPYTADVIRNAD